MSSILFKSTIAPQAMTAGAKAYDSYESPFMLENVIEFTEAEFEALNNPDPKAARSMSRSSLLMTDVGMQAQAAIKETIESNPFRVHMYAIIDNGPDDYKSCISTAELSDAEFPQLYKKSRSPKQYLKQLPNVAPAQLGIFLGVMGSTNVYVHTQHGVLQALEQAEVDLATGVTDLALVVSSFSLEDALQAKRYQLLGTPTTALAEGAAALVLSKSSEMTNWKEKIHSLKNPYSYGIATKLINLIKEGKV
jgi:3-oxoacyl-(acyl-carrier-protein) synthase